MLPLVFAAGAAETGLPGLPAAVSAAAPAAVAVNQPSPDVAAPARLRSGLVVGLSLGGAVGGSSGYPNASSDIDNPAFYSASGFMAGSNGTLFVMGALTDYLSFGFWAGSTMYRNGDWRASAAGGGLRVEAFPFIGISPVLGGLGVLGNFGVGGGHLQSTNPLRPEASGTQSYLGGGVFWEFPFGHLFGGHFAVGPNLEYDAMFSRPFESHGLVASLRIVFYGGP